MSEINSLLMRESVRCYNQFKEVKETQIYMEFQKGNKFTNRHEIAFCREPCVGRGEGHALFICISLDMIYFVLLSVIYNLQCYKIAER